MSLLHEYLFPVVWLGWAAYWVLSASSVSAPRRIEKQSARTLRQAELLLAYALLAFPQLGIGWLGLRIVPRTEPLFVSGAAMLILGIGFAVWARVHLGVYWSSSVTLKPGHRLIRSGPYALVRHPIYTGLLLALLGTAVSLDEYRGVLAVIIAVGAFVRKLRLEERWLTEEFGGEYDSYRRDVKALVPGVV
jgi:protein-S-isoprenylcysteine O-methyltransferase Ste14